MKQTLYTLSLVALVWTQFLFASSLLAEEKRNEQHRTFVFKIDRNKALGRGFELNEALLKEVAEQMKKRLQQLDKPGEAAIPVEVKVDLEEERLTVACPAKTSADRVQKVKAALLNGTWVEFAILANQQQHSKLIDLASDEKHLKGNRVYQAQQLVGLWLPVAFDHEKKPKIEPQGKVATRAGPNGNGSPLEYLVVVDADRDSRLTGLDFVNVEKQKTDFGFALGFQLNQHGAALMQAITTENQPSYSEVQTTNRPQEEPQAVEAAELDEEAPVRTRLAIIINEQIVMAPIIHGVISSSGVLQGRFKETEVEELVDSLQLPPLVVPLVLVEEI